MAIDNENVEQTTEIPAELTGISDETLREILGELSQDDTGTPAPDQELEGKEETEESDEAEDSEGAETEENTAETDENAEANQEQPESQQKKTVPYAALKEEREKRKSLSQELEETKRMVQELKQQQQQQTTPQRTVETPPADEKKVNPDEVAATYHEQLYEEAQAKFQKIYGREPDEFSSRDMVFLNRIAGEIDFNVRKNYEKTVAEQAERQNSYQSFVQEAMAKEDYKETADFIVERVHQLPPTERDYIISAYRRADQGQATIEDIYCIKNFWAAGDALYKLQKQQADKEADPEKPEPTPDPVKKTVEKTAEKIEKIKAHPKSTQIKGGGANNGGMTEAELERLMDTEDWGKIPPDIKKILKGG